LRSYFSDLGSHKDAFDGTLFEGKRQRKYTVANFVIPCGSAAQQSGRIICSALTETVLSGRRGAIMPLLP
jgi:hypothetical protein